MKVIQSLFADFMTAHKIKQPVICQYVMAPNGDILLELPQLSSEIICKWCGGHEYYAPFIDPSQSGDRAWLCANIECSVYKAKTRRQAISPQTARQRAILWPLFCEINGVGDCHHDVKFESIQQSEGKISYLLKFSSSPRGIILMTGQPGTGKSYSALATCELFTRRETSAHFITQKKLATKWLTSFKDTGYDYFLEKLAKCNLLVIDDFAVGEVPAGFLSYFMDLINERMQWTNRGTIITTNLDDKKMGLYCGEALADRLNTGQKFEFTGPSRRKTTPL